MRALIRSPGDSADRSFAVMRVNRMRHRFKAEEAGIVLTANRG